MKRSIGFAVLAMMMIAAFLAGCGGGGGSSTPVTPPSPVTPPVAPTVTDNAAGAASATITWGAVSGATSYNLYYSTASGVDNTTGTKVAGATSPTTIDGLIRGVTYYFVVTAANSGGEGAESAEVSVVPDPPAQTFAQSELAGVWNIRVLLSGSAPGTSQIRASIDGAGTVTVLSAVPDPPPTPDIGTLVVADNGAVTETGVGANDSFYGQLSTSKDLIVATASIPSGGANYALYVFVREDSTVTFSSADVASKSFIYQRIYSGNNHDWESAVGTTNAAGQITLTSKVDSNGVMALPGANYTTFSINASGIVTIGNEASFSGVMTPDKQLIVGTSTDAVGRYSLRIIQMRGQTYTQADLAGVYTAHSFHSDSASSWARATWTTNLVGTVSASDILNSDGSVGTPPPAWTHTIQADGDVNVDGSLSYGKDLLVFIDDYLDGSSMTIVVQ